MSSVTNIILTGNFGDDEVQKIALLIKELEIGMYSIFLRNNGEENVGTKAMESDVFLMAFNYFKTSEFIEGLEKIIRNSKWTDTIGAQIFIKEENEDTFKEIELESI